jgi:hypothetical protein
MKPTWRIALRRREGAMRLRAALIPYCGFSEIRRLSK